MTTSGAASRRVAAIDCGTNSLRLLVAEPDGRGGLREITRQLRIVRLGQGVDETGRLHPDAIARAAAALAEYADVIGTTGAGRVRMVATSAVRDVSDRTDFDAMVTRVLGQPPEVISGVEEASLSFAGACSALPPDVIAGSGGGDTVLVVDLGGGSTELVSGTAAGVSDAVSLDVGSVRLTERHVRHDPLAAREQDAIAADVRAALAAGGLPASRAQLVGVAGTVTTVAALALGLRRYEPGAIEGCRLGRDRIDAVAATLLAMDRRQRLDTGVIHPGRVDVIGAGAVILQTVMSELDASDIVVTGHDILDGVAAALL